MDGSKRSVNKRLDLNVDEIKDMQRRLRRVGYSCQVTGVFDMASVRSLRAFQRDLRLNPSGQLDKRSDDVLGRCASNMTKETV